jgi:hypothetical protein
MLPFEIDQPTTPAVADMEYPKDIQKLIKAHRLLMVQYQVEKKKLDELKAESQNAEYNDIEALRQAAIAGEPDPGMDASQKATRAVEYQNIRTKAAVQAVRSATSLVNAALMQNRLVIIELACEMLQKGATEWDQALVKLQVDFAEAYEKKRESINGMRTVFQLDLTKPEISFGLDNIHRAAEGFRVPESDKSSVWLVKTLREIYAEGGKHLEAQAELLEEEPAK